ncbi:MAG: S8 family peptidase [Magnetococcus sp. WYHC-3]
MADHLPLLVFPQAKTIPPPAGKPFPKGHPHLPSHDRQVKRLTEQMDALQQGFSRYKASVGGAIAGMEPETVLVIEIAGSVDDFKQAVEALGLEWLGEWDIDGIEPDEEFYETNTKGDRTDKTLKGRMFLSLANESGLQELLALWKQWTKNESLPHGKTKWRDVFNQILTIRRWGIEETLRETGMIDRWRDLLDPIQPTQAIHCQIELFYRRNPVKRQQSARSLSVLLEEVGGQILGPFIDMPDIAFHAVKAQLPAKSIRLLLEEVDAVGREIDIQLFKFPGVMYFRPTGQSLVASQDDPGEATQFPPGVSELPPVAAILDGVPNLLHDALKDRLLFDDPDNLEEKYQPGERKHGTSMASLVVHGELGGGRSLPLNRKVYFRPIMEPDPKHPKRPEHIPDEVFFEDRIERAVLRMVIGEGNVPAQAPGVKIINLSICDLERPFIHTPSPLARVLDWLSWKYRVLFCVSTGNFLDGIDVGIFSKDFSQLSDDKKIEQVLKSMAQQLSARRLLSPAESLNALTIGALHTDESGDYTPVRRTDLLPNSAMVSPVSRFGHGFRRSVKPEILFPGGRQLYSTPNLDKDTVFERNETVLAPGQRVAWDSRLKGEMSPTAHTRGTSNAAALATRSGVRIYEVLEALRKEHGEQIRDDLMAVLIKALLVHGARHDEGSKSAITAALKNKKNSRSFKEVLARYIGYGAVDIERVLTCTEQRGTVLGCGEIRENEIHEYRLPLPPDLSGQELWRRLVVTLAWFSPINPDHRNLREAKLELSPGRLKWDTLPIHLTRQGADHNQVSRGTVQHEILEGKDQIAAYEDGEHLLLHVICKKDATERLDAAIPYGLAVTLEVAEGVSIPIYEQLRVRLKPRVAVGAAAGNP